MEHNIKLKSSCDYYVCYIYYKDNLLLTEWHKDAGHYVDIHLNPDSLAPEQCYKLYSTGAVERPLRQEQCILLNIHCIHNSIHRVKQIDIYRLDSYSPSPIPPQKKHKHIVHFIKKQPLYNTSLASVEEMWVRLVIFGQQVDLILCQVNEVHLLCI